MAPPKLTAKSEETLRTKIFREFGGVNTQATRVAIPETSFFNLENLQPIGPANLVTVPGLSASLVDYAGDAIYYGGYANINGNDYVILFATNGKVFAYRLDTGVSTQINAAPTLFSGSGSRFDQFKSQSVVFIDANGYFTWDGTTFAKVTGVGVPASGTDIAVYAGRVWIAQGRVITCGAADLIDATAFDAANGAITVNLSDPQIRGSSITRMLSANGYLYVFGKSSINAISDVYIPSGASPPAPVYTNLNIQALIGTLQPASVTVYGRDVVFANKYGLFALRGVTVQRISGDIDGTIRTIDFTQSISAGLTAVNNILNVGFLIKQVSDPFVGNRTSVAMYFDGKWWFANYGELTFVFGVVNGETPQMMGFIGNKLYRLFSDTTTAPASKFSTALWPMEESLSDKEIIRAGVEVTSTQYNGTFTLTIDTPTSNSTFIPTGSVGVVQWANNAGTIVNWQNNLLALVSWFSGSYLLVWGNGNGVFGKYVGFSGSAPAGSIYVLNSLAMDYELRRRWN